MVLGFKTEINGKPTLFQEKILSSFLPEELRFSQPKFHTIRKGNRWKFGYKIHFATGVRTKFYNCFHIGVCYSVQSIEIVRCDDLPLSEYNNQVYLVTEPWFVGVKFNAAFKVEVDGRALAVEEIITLAQNDGFDHINDIFEWFEFKEFSGQLIHWTDLRY